MENFLSFLRRPAEIIMDPLERAMKRMLCGTPNSYDREMEEISRSVQRALHLDRPPTWSPEAEKVFIDAHSGSSGRD